MVEVQISVMTGQGARRRTRNLSVLFKRGSKARESIQYKAELAAQESSGKKGFVNVGSINTKGHSKLVVLTISLIQIFSIIWLTGHQQQNKDQNALTGNKRKLQPNIPFP